MINNSGETNRRTLIGNNMKTILKEQFKQLYPSVKEYQVEKAVNIYVDEVMKELLEQFMRMSSEDMAAGEINFPFEKLTKACGQITIDGSKQHIFNVMQKHAQTSLIIKAYNGNNLTGKVSRVTINHKFKGQIMAEFTNTDSLLILLDPKKLKAQRENANMSVSVNTTTLESFINRTRETLNDGTHKSEKYVDALNRNLTLATTLLAQLQYDEEGNAFFAEEWKAIDSGRLYGIGLSLQTVPKEVRHAALGKCHKYDFKASSFALLTDLALSIDPSLKVGYLKDYIKNRAAIRTRIANELNISEKQIKAIFTSIGFGAKLVNNPHNSIRAALGRDEEGKAKFEQLMNNYTFKMIVEQFDQVTNTIHNATPNDTFELGGYTYTQIDKEGNKRNKNQKISWIYQVLESVALEILTSAIPSTHKTLLLVHDCVYLDNKLNDTIMADVIFKLDQQFPHLRMEHEQIDPIQTSKQSQVNINDHKQFMRNQERIAQTYNSDSITSTNMHKRQIQTAWGMIDADMIEPFIDNNEYYKETY
jgi:hypothetical protein